MRKGCCEENEKQGRIPPRPIEKQQLLGPKKSINALEKMLTHALLKANFTRNLLQTSRTLCNQPFGYKLTFSESTAF